MNVPVWRSEKGDRGFPLNTIARSRFHWFQCQECGFNGDRDYIAALNIARRGLAKLAKRKEPKPVPYSGSGLALPFPPTQFFANRIFTALTGFNKSAVLMPVYPLIC